MHSQEVYFLAFAITAVIRDFIMTIYFAYKSLVFTQDLIQLMLTKDPAERVTADEVMTHEWVNVSYTVPN